MNRKDVLFIERKRIIDKLNTDHKNRAKWLAALIDVDDEIEQISSSEKKQVLLGMKASGRRQRRA